jgi:tyrosyl-tRNA synthetase
MTKGNMCFFEEFEQRGFLHQVTNLDRLKSLSKKNAIVAYIGFDCTADSLHVGSLLQIMKLRLLQKHGHKPVVLIGGGTTKVGDPSGRDETRKLLSQKDIEFNKAGIKAVLEKFLHFGSGKNDAIMVDNDDWLSKLNYIDFLRDVGSHFSVNRMLSFDSVKMRLEREQNLSFIEFNYMIMQAYDFVVLNKKYGCNLQMGGSDQWGNIVSGIELARRLGSEEELLGLTSPLMTTSSGAKMGKTASGAVWLSPEKLAPYDYYQFWRNSEDDDALRFLKLFTDLSLDEIEEMKDFEGKELNEVKKLLAFEATKLCHGVKAAKSAELTAKMVFEQGLMAGDIPQIEISAQEFEKGIQTYKIFQMAKLVETGGEAKRLVAGGGARINDEIVKDEFRIVSMEDVHDGIIKLSAGKKKHALVVLSK